MLIKETRKAQCLNLLGKQSKLMVKTFTLNTCDSKDAVKVAITMTSCVTDSEIVKLCPALLMKSSLTSCIKVVYKTISAPRGCSADLSFMCS